MNLKNTAKKSSALLLVSLTIFTIPSPCQAMSASRAIAKTSAIFGGSILTGTGAYYAGNKLLDRLDPNRAIIRENVRKSRSELPSLERELLDKKTTSQRKTELVQEINSRRAIIAEAEKNSSGSMENLPVIGGIASFCATAFSIIEGVGSLCKKITNIACLRFAYQHLVALKDDVKKSFEPKAKELSKDEVFSKFDTAFANIEGQDKAIREVKNHLYDIVVAKNQAKWKKEKYSHGDVLYFYGVSGVGKSLVSNRVANTIYSNPKIYTVTTSDVDKDKKDSVVSQLFGAKAAANSNPYLPQVPKTNSLAEFLKSNPNGIVRIEEYDKICTPALDEVIRTIVECGVVNIDGEKVDCSGILFILTSNEDKTSMEGFDKSNPTALDKESIKQGYTRVWHDKSFLNRIRKVEFKNLEVDSYEKIFRKHFEDLGKYWADSQNAGINLKIDEKTIKFLAGEIEKFNEGARPIDLKIIPEIQGGIGDKIKSAPSLDFYRNKTFNISYNDETKKFEITAE